MEIYHYEGDLHELAKWAVNRGMGIKYQEPPAAFQKVIGELLPEGLIGHFVNVQITESPNDGEWADRFPHVHMDPENSCGWEKDTYTLLTYLATDIEGGEFALGGESPDDPYEIVKVEPGMIIKVNEATWHGVRKCGKGIRLSIVTTSFKVHE